MSFKAPDSNSPNQVKYWRRYETKHLKAFLQKHPYGKISDYLGVGGSGAALIRYQKNCKNTKELVLFLDWDKNTYFVMPYQTYTECKEKKKRNGDIKENEAENNKTASAN